MMLREVIIDSVRSALMRGEWSLILKEKVGERYLPIYMGPSHANIVKRELLGIRFGETETYERFLAGGNIAGCKLESVIIESSKNGDFHAKLLLTQGGDSFETDCPVAAATALGFRRMAPILVDEGSFQEAGISLSN